jgi:hypothetical protein
LVAYPTTSIGEQVHGNLFPVSSTNFVQAVLDEFVDETV